MPSGYAGEGRVWSPTLGKWVKRENKKAFDYGKLNKKSLALLISFFRFYPDYFYDLIQSPNAKYNQELIQRVMLRIFARYRNVYITGSRGTTKTYVVNLSNDHEGLWFPGIFVRYVGPTQKQSAEIASKAFKTVCTNFPPMSAWWDRKNDREAMFRITTPYGSEFSMYAPRGDNCNATVAEEMGAEGEDAFDMQKYESDIAPTRRQTRCVNRVPDRTYVQLKSHHIGNACSKTNKAFMTYRAGALHDMIYGDRYDGFVLDIPWQVSLLCGIRDIAYFKQQRKEMTPENWLREFCAIYTGSGDSPMVADMTLARSHRLMVVETEAKADANAIYLVCHDVSAIDSATNAKCADIVFKLTRYTDEDRKDIYRKQVVFLDTYAPPATNSQQGRKLKALWRKYCTEKALAFIVIDANGNGDAVLQELIKNTADGMPICTIEHTQHKEIEQPGAREVIYPLKAGGRGSRDPDTEMVSNAQAEFAHFNVELPTIKVLDGVDAYKKKNGIKDNFADIEIARPYQQSEILSQQIANLQVIGGKEKRKSKHIQRDLWSALKYGLWFAKILENKLQFEIYGAKSDWAEEIERYKKNGLSYSSVSHQSGERSRLLAMRRR